LDLKVACIVLTLNEEPRIEHCLLRLRKYLDYILVFDDGSTDRTVEIASKYADKVIEGQKFEGFDKKKNYAWSMLPDGFDWVLFSDVDEVWDPVFLQEMKEIIKENDVQSFKFPRINLPDGKNYPDYQTRLLRNDGDIIWMGKVHEVPWSVSKEKPIDQVSVSILMNYPIVHLSRRTDIKRPWW